MDTAGGTGSCARRRRFRRPVRARADMSSCDRLLEKIEGGADGGEAVALAVVWPLVFLHDRVVVAVDRYVRQSHLLARRRAARPGDAGDAETDLRAKARTRAAGERPGDDRRDRAVSVDEVGRNIGEDRLGLVRVDDRAALEVRARAAVRGEDRRE